MRYVVADNPVSPHPLNLGLSAWWLHLPNRLVGYNHAYVASKLADDTVPTTLELAGPSIGEVPSNGRGLGPPGRWGSWDFGNAAITDRVRLTSGFTNLFSGQQVHTISLWVRPRSFANSPVVYSHTLNDTNFFAEFDTSGYLYWGYGGSFRTYTSGQATANAWNHLVFSRTGSGNSGNLYVNGVLASSYTGTFGSTPTDTQNLWIGNYNSTGLGLDGCIDDFRVYKSRALDESEAYQLFREGFRGYPTLLRWRRRGLTVQPPAAPAGHPASRRLGLCNGFRPVGGEGMRVF